MTITAEGVSVLVTVAVKFGVSVKVAVVVKSEVDIAVREPVCVLVDCVEVEALHAASEMIIKIEISTNTNLFFIFSFLVRNQLIYAAILRSVY